MTAAPASPARPALRWFGGKWRLGPWIVQHLPPHAAYCEPYGGAASVLLRKPPARLETWNDLHGRLVSFFRVLRERPDELVRLLALTPYARQEYEQAREVAADPLEDARRFYILAAQGRVGAAGAAERGRVRPSVLYAELYDQTGWRRIERSSLLDSGRSGVEALWLNPAAAAALCGQLHLHLALGNHHDQRQGQGEELSP